MNPTEIDFTKCQHHAVHDRRRVTRRLSEHKLDDVPKVPAYLDKELDLEIFAWDHYSDESFNRYDYCPGQDTVSFCLDVQGIWEPVETLAVLDILQTSGWVVDIGSHFGYYCALAGACGCGVFMVEANPELAVMAAHNTRWNAVGNPGQGASVQLIQNLSPIGVEPTRLLIADVEGAERYALNYYRASFEAGMVDYVLLEISPTFNDTYPEIVRQMIQWGFVGYMIPHKGWDRLGEYAENPLLVIQETPEVIPATVQHWRQENVLFMLRA